MKTKKHIIPPVSQIDNLKHYLNGNHAWDTVKCDYNKNCSDCDPDDYHRYCKLVDFKITSIDTNKFIENCLNYFGENEIDKYCLDRILSKSKNISDPYSWEPNIQNGYYGEELNSVNFICASEILNQVEQLTAKPENLHKIFYVLELEYGYLADIIKNANNFTIKTVDRSQLVMPNENYARKLDKEYVEKYSNYKLPIGIYTRAGDNYKIVDGYHRGTAFLNSNREEAKIIVAEF